MSVELFHGWETEGGGEEQDGGKVGLPASNLALLKSLAFGCWQWTGGNVHELEEVSKR